VREKSCKKFSERLKKKMKPNKGFLRITMMEVITMSNLNVERILKGAVLMHLTEDELGAYHDNAVDEVTRSRIEAHLDRCLICERKLAMMQEMLATYHQETVTEEDIARAKELLHPGMPKPEKTKEKDTEDAVALEPVAVIRMVLPVAFAAWIKQHRIRVALAGARAAGTTEPQDGQTEDGILRWRSVEEESGDLVFRFGSDHMELVGQKLLLKVGKIKKEVVLESKMRGKQAGAKTIFTREERMEMPEDEPLTLELLEE